MSPSAGRLLTFTQCGPTENMAIDQALLESVDAGGLPTLRLYGWNTATLSLGYFQRHADRSEHPESESLPCVRRATGGGAIVHDRELTYSLVLPVDVRNSGPRHQIYRETHAAISDALRDLSVVATPYRSRRRLPSAFSDDCFLCFQRRTDEDLIVSGYKVVGSAQRTMRRAVLQHGSILLNVSPAAPQLPGICDLASRPFAFDQLASGLVIYLADRLKLSWQPCRLSDDELDRARGIEAEKFANDRWFYRR